MLNLSTSLLLDTQMTCAKEMQELIFIYTAKARLIYQSTAALGTVLKSKCSLIIWQNASYQALYDKVKSLIIDNVCMKFYDETKPLYLETDATILQNRYGMTCPKDTAPDNIILRPITFASTSLASTEWRYSNIKREALGILHGLERFHHNYFAREVSIITDHELLVAIFKIRCGNTLSKNTMHSPQDTPILGQDFIQVWARAFHCRLATIIQRTKMQRSTAWT